MISTVNLSVQFGEKPLFENVSIKFSGGNRYGLIGANGCGKSTFMKILSGEQEASSGEVVIDTNTRLGKLGQDQFAYEDVNVLDVVMMGHEEMWSAMTERDSIYANTDATDEDYIKAAELESKYAEFGGYSSEARAGELLIGAGIELDLHKGSMKNVPPGWKVIVRQRGAWGGTAGTYNTYVSPAGKKFRSVAAVLRFLRQKKLKTESGSLSEERESRPRTPDYEVTTSNNKNKSPLS